MALFLIWEAVARLGAISPLLLPAPSEVLMTTVKDFPLLYQMSVVTAAEFLLGFGLSVVVGLPVGALIVYARPVELSLYPLLVAFQTMPKAAIAPIFVVWLGTGITSKVLIAFAIAFFPIVIDTIDRPARRPARDDPSRCDRWGRTPFRCSGTCAFRTRCRPSSAA